MFNMNFLIADVVWFVFGTMTTFSLGDATKVKSRNFSENSATQPHLDSIITCREKNGIIN